MKNKLQILLWSLPFFASYWAVNEIGKQRGYKQGFADGKASVRINDSLAYKEGWMAYSLDEVAVGGFHSRMDSMRRNFTDTDEAAAIVWQQCQSAAEAMRAQWNLLSVEQKIATPTESFWDSGRGMPRRFK